MIITTILITYNIIINNDINNIKPKQEKINIQTEKLEEEQRKLYNLIK